MHVPGDGRGERALWASIVLQIVADASSTPAPTQKDALRARDEAQRWLAGSISNHKRRVLALAGVDDAESFFRRVREGAIHLPSETRGRRAGGTHSAR